MDYVDLNCDLGESFGQYKIGMDEEIIPLISSANVACGFHASDPLIMEKTVALAKKNEIAIGAHPGFYDLMGFGRREMKIQPEEAKAYVTYQIGALDAFCRANGMKIAHVKPHGALYNMAGKDYALAKAICEAIREFDPSIILLGLANSELIKAAEDINLPVAREFFADRAYEEDGSLVARTKKGAMITEEDEAIARVIKVIKEGKVTAVTGKEISLKIDSICVHGDGEKALVFVEKIREQLRENQIGIKPLQELLSGEQRNT